MDEEKEEEQEFYVLHTHNTDNSLITYSSLELGLW